MPIPRQTPSNSLLRIATDTNRFPSEYESPFPPATTVPARIWAQPTTRIPDENKAGSPDQPRSIQPTPPGGCAQVRPASTLPCSDHRTDETSLPQTTP